MEKEIIRQIFIKFKEINQIGSVYNSGNNLEYLTQNILELIKKLASSTENKELQHNCKIAYWNLSQTLKKEVGWVIITYDKSIKKNGAKVRHTEYLQKLTRAIKGIEQEIFPVINFYNKE